MATVPAVIDLAALLAPLPGGNRAGVNLRYETISTSDKRNPKYWYDAIREAAVEDLLAWAGPRYSDWSAVSSLCTDALTTRSKDLQIAAWLTEARTCNSKGDGFAGLRDGLKLLGGLIGNFWDDLYPESDPEDPDGQFTARANALDALVKSLAMAVKKVPLSNGATGLRYSFNQYESSKVFKVIGQSEDHVAQVRERLKQDNEIIVSQDPLRTVPASEPKITDEDWARAHQTTAYEHYWERLELLNECLAELKALDEAMDEKFHHETPGMKELERSLEDVQRLARKLADDKRPAKASAPEEVAVANNAEQNAFVPDTAAVQAGPVITAGTVRDRQEALQRLSEIANYFRRAEPHSPVSFLVERAVKWGNLPFDQLLVELIKDATELGRLRELLGLKSEEVNSDAQ
ncbi:MAG: type VI secretion system ImpA family N-terminal domain-containing protein [Acidobacteriota bacterium]